MADPVPTTKDALLEHLSALYDRIADAAAYRDEMAALFHASTEALRTAEDAAMVAARAQDDTPTLIVACEVAQKTADGTRAIWDEYRVALDQAEGALADLQDEASDAGLAVDRLMPAVEQEKN